MALTEHIKDLLQTAVYHEKQQAYHEQAYQDEKAKRNEAACSAAVACFPNVAFGDEHTVTFVNWRGRAITETYRVVRFRGSIYKGTFTAEVVTQKVTKSGELSKSSSPSTTQTGGYPAAWKRKVVDLADLNDL